jgi:hypothetical protein
VLLTDLFEDQEATVLQLPAQPATAAEAEAQADPNAVTQRLALAEHEVSMTIVPAGSLV